MSIDICTQRFIAALLVIAKTLKLEIIQMSVNW